MIGCDLSLVMIGCSILILSHFRSKILSLLMIGCGLTSEILSDVDLSQVIIMIGCGFSSSFSLPFSFRNSLSGYD